MFELIADVENAYAAYKKSGYTHPEGVLYSNEAGTLQFLARKYFHNADDNGWLKDIGFKIVSNVIYDEMLEFYLKIEKTD